MLKNLFNGILSTIAIRLLDSYRYLSIEFLKIEAAKCYIRSVQMARLAALGLMQMGLTIGLICLGLAAFHIGLFILLPWTIETKAIVCMALGLVYVVIGSIGLTGSMSEKTWMERSGATEVLNDAINQHPALPIQTEEAGRSTKQKP